jgi:hypothetical protein
MNARPFLIAGAVLATGFTLSSFGTFDGQPEPFGFTSPEYPDADSADRTLLGTDADTSCIKGGMTYAQYNADRSDWLDSFKGYGCKESCAGHEAGYAWAEKNGIGDPADCGGNSWDFEEGCAAYATGGA